MFTATPQGYLSGVLTEEILNKCRFIDLSADYRIKDVAIGDRIKSFFGGLFGK